MIATGKPRDSVYTFETSIMLETSGRVGHTIRILPAERDQENLFHDGLIHWASGL
jgi:hypothetical protein